MTALQTNLDPASERVRMLYVWDAAHRNWVLPKKQFKKLKKEAREASSSRS
jgi:hypothetical protein